MFDIVFSVYMRMVSVALNIAVCFNFCISRQKELISQERECLKFQFKDQILIFDNFSFKLF